MDGNHPSVANEAKGAVEYLYGTPSYGLSVAKKIGVGAIEFECMTRLIIDL